jgi:transposase-like protein
MSPNPDTEEKLAAAKEDLLKGRIATVAAAAREHGVTEKQLRNRLKGIGPLSSRPVNGKNLSDGQEEGLCLYIQKMDDISFPIIPEAVEAYANGI